jgi:hypothetical protein
VRQVSRTAGIDVEDNNTAMHTALGLELNPSIF